MMSRYAGRSDCRRAGRRLRIPGLSSRHTEDLNEFSHNLQLALLRSCEVNVLEVRVDRLEGDLGVTPGVAIRDLLALVALDGVALAVIGIGDVAQLHKHNLALPRAKDGRPEEAVRAVRDGGLHRLADDLGDEH